MHKWIVLKTVLMFLTTVTLASTNNALPDDGVATPKHVGADFRFSPCIIVVNHFYFPTNALNYTKLGG